MTPEEEQWLKDINAASYVRPLTDEEIERVRELLGDYEPWVAGRTWHSV
jgi:hypothetical protein